jgi:nucleoside-diphosphate-sugar epimerase
MKALVTGATGFTGGHLATFLVRAGDRVRVLVRQPAQADRFSARGFDVAIGDLTDRSSLERAVAGVEIVYNIAALYREAGHSAEIYRAVNAEAVGTLVHVARDAGVQRVVHCSTVGVHGDIEQPPANEDAPLRPGDVYQKTKLLGEEIGRAEAAKTGIALTIVRPTGIYGPGDRRLFKLFGQIARGRFVMLGRGSNFYHVTYIDDLCAGFRLCGTVPQAAGRTYILGGQDVHTLAELVRMTAEISGSKGIRLRLPIWPVWAAGAACELVCAPFRIAPPLYRRRVDFFRKSRAFDISRARRELGFAPNVPVRDGIRRTLEWYREHGWI